VEQLHEAALRYLQSDSTHVSARFTTGFSVLQNGVDLYRVVVRGDTIFWESGSTYEVFNTFGSLNEFISFIKTLDNNSENEASTYIESARHYFDWMNEGLYYKIVWDPNQDGNYHTDIGRFDSINSNGTTLTFTLENGQTYIIPVNQIKNLSQADIAAAIL